eukprot:12899500-Prorocentrum_lima.AAC.1
MAYLASTKTVYGVHSPEYTRVQKELEAATGQTEQSNPGPNAADDADKRVEQAKKAKLHAGI